MLAAMPIPVTRPSHALISWIPAMRRVGQQHRPEHRESKLSAYLRVGRDAAGVVVGSTGYDAGT
jgi:hypothetical protein